MSQPHVREMLFELGAQAPPGLAELTPRERCLLDHLTVVMALTPKHLSQWRALGELVGRGGATDEVRRAAGELAEELAAVLQSLGRRPELVASAVDTPMDPSAALAVLAQIFFSYTTLLHPGAPDLAPEEALGLYVSEEELAELVALPAFAAFFTALGGRPPALTPA